ncbi:hypothetical protein D8B26_004587 [Coccidioides posadasii str. Silveira]|uniref:Uncharacterized protein n=2 Tax=Coccidioides posadasii TaxID=199306 RepID=E9DEJ0_COCPS|nr:hypothetical protein CPSG_08240 [Coccidioides posadasii str. Silveira]KMM68821.1 hypothetical protein CPAG_05145 [Coccidioides posadasii RMSCC 3488]QVM09926.1 hypothetical protein D8B26_004587 [Coccidioides posadasii str. Silveira]
MQKSYCLRESSRHPSNWGFSGFMKTAAHQVLDKVPVTKAQEFHSPVFCRLGVGIIIDSYTRIQGVQIFRLRHINPQPF